MDNRGPDNTHVSCTDQEEEEGDQHLPGNREKKKKTSGKIRGNSTRVVPGTGYGSTTVVTRIAMLILSKDYLRLIPSPEEQTQLKEAIVEEILQGG